jgi:hypothetical protein
MMDLSKQKPQTFTEIIMSTIEFPVRELSPESNNLADIESENPLSPYARVIAVAEQIRECGAQRISEAEECVIQDLRKMTELPVDVFNVALCGIKNAIDKAGGPYNFLTKRD